MKAMKTSRRAAILAVAIVGCGSLTTAQSAHADGNDYGHRPAVGSLSYGGRAGQGQQSYRYSDSNSSRGGGAGYSQGGGTSDGSLRYGNYAGHNQSPGDYSAERHNDEPSPADGGYRSHDQVGDGGHNHDGYDGRDGGRADQHHDGDHSSDSSSGTKKLVIGVVIGAILGAVLGH
jgi:hypothetical protein